MRVLAPTPVTPGFSPRRKWGTARRSSSSTPTTSTATSSSTSWASPSGLQLGREHSSWVLSRTSATAARTTPGQWLTGLTVRSALAPCFARMDYRGSRQGRRLPRERRSISHSLKVERIPYVGESGSRSARSDWISPAMAIRPGFGPAGPLADSTLNSEPSSMVVRPSSALVSDSRLSSQGLAHGPLGVAGNSGPLSLY